MKWKVGDTCYIILLNGCIAKATITKKHGNMYQLDFDQVKSVLLPGSRLFRSPEEAKPLR